MIFHVLPGDSLVEEFKKSGIAGEVIVCREALISGPIDAENLDEFWDQRARFILAEYAEDEIEYQEKVADQLSRLTELTAEDEVNLWFEYELFCSVNMWFCLSLLSNTDAKVYRVEPIGLDVLERWEGFGKFAADDLKACFELRTELTKNDVDLGSLLWDAYRHKDQAGVNSLADTESTCFPYLKEVARAAVDEDVEPVEVLRAITQNGETDFGKIFVEFKKRAGVYGYGDLQVQALLDRLHS
ncbi:MAG: DUF1835 domain-containing protein [Pyrinomonadaceae bacterium]